MATTDGVTEFLAVVERGTFTRAAEELGVSKSYVSRSLTRLEARLGARLLTRTTRRVLLTDIGRHYYQRCRQAMDDLDAAEVELSDLQARPKGKIRLTAPGVYAERYVTPVLVEFTLMYPEVEIHLDTQMATVDLIADGYDLAVRMSSLEDSTLIARKVQSRRILVCGAPDYLARQGRPATPDMLARHNCLRLGNMAWRFSMNDQIREVRVHGSWSSDNGSALVTAARAGIGLVRITDYYVALEIERGELVTVLEDYEVDDAATWILFPNRLHLPTRVRLLIEFLVDSLRKRN
ncbi:MAG: LysR family transcriptional regulator [Gammaproteobacteria bacterium]|nr:LysR family transcriptional regulator [Gammaproteobacteria bacterium]